MDRYYCAVAGCVMTKQHETMITEGVCPRCGSTEIYRDDVNIGVGIIYGPYGCPECGWSESEEYDLEFDGGLQEDGSYLDPYGGLWPATNPVVLLMKKMSEYKDG